MNRFLIIDDHPLFREAFCMMLDDNFKDSCIISTGSLEGGVKILKKDDNFDLIFLDLMLPDSSGLDGLLILRNTYPYIPIIISSSLEGNIIKQTYEYGISAYITKSTSKAKLLTIIQNILQGGSWTPNFKNIINDNSDIKKDIIKKLLSLTPRQSYVLKMLKQGLLNKQIAYELSITEPTVKAHISEIFRKLEVSTRTKLIIEVSKVDLELSLENQE